MLIAFVVLIGFVHALSSNQEVRDDDVIRSILMNPKNSISYQRQLDFSPLITIRVNFNIEISNSVQIIDHQMNYDFDETNK
jgi:hypothetical protein